MILGIGVDIVETIRIEEILKKRPKFLDRVFTDQEIKYFKDKGFKINSIAGSFAAKEAVSKVFGTGISGLELKDIEVLHDDSGKPYVKLYNNAKMIMHDLGIENIYISISHSDNNAVCFAVGEKA
jgi:holo-[acyl-carrier protein] synthase